MRAISMKKTPIPALVSNLTEAVNKGAGRGPEAFFFLGVFLFPQSDHTPKRCAIVRKDKICFKKIAKHKSVK
jgi:hypothetical protein